MGVSNNGILVYGSECEGDGSAPEWLLDKDGDEIDFDDFIILKAGREDFLEVSYEDRKAILNSCPIDLVRHCHYDYPMYILAVPGTKKTSARGYPSKITSLEVDATKIEAFMEYCTKHNIPIENELGWLLCTMNG